MGALIDDAALKKYREDGFISPIRIFSTEEAAQLRAAIEAVEVDRGPVFREDRKRPGDPFQGSYRDCWMWSSR